MKHMMPVKVLMLVIFVIAIVFGWQGVAMHMQVQVEEGAFHELQKQYYSQSKSVRDSAATNSALNEDLVAIQQYPSTLLQLKLVGIGKILTGIFFLLVGILMALIAMPIRLHNMMAMKKKKK